MERNRGELQEDKERTRREKEARDRKVGRHRAGERAGRREKKQERQNRTGRQRMERHKLTQDATK